MLLPGLLKFRAGEKARLERFAAEIKAKPVLLEGSATRELVRLATTSKFRAIVLGTHGLKGVKRMFLGSVAEEVIRRSAIPACVIGPKAQEAGPNPPKRKPKILLSTDLGENSRPAQNYAIHLAKRLGAELIVVHCVYQGQDPMVQMALNTTEGQMAMAQIFGDLCKDSQQKLAKLRKDLARQGLVCHTVSDARAAFAYRSILRHLAKFQADLVVMGTHGRTLIGKAFFGSTTRQTILNSPVPVVTVRRFGRS
jgi:nucleotide-binding universal stress UspA family protein